MTTFPTAIELVTSTVPVAEDRVVGARADLVAWWRCGTRSSRPTAPGWPTRGHPVNDMAGLGVGFTPTHPNQRVGSPAAVQQAPGA